MRVMFPANAILPSYHPTHLSGTVIYSQELRPVPESTDLQVQHPKIVSEIPMEVPQELQEAPLVTILQEPIPDLMEIEVMASLHPALQGTMG